MKTYTITGSGVDHDGWFRYRLRRSDGLEVRAGKSRVRQLRRAGRLTSHTKFTAEQLETLTREFSKLRSVNRDSLKWKSFVSYLNSLPIEAQQQLIEAGIPCVKLVLMDTARKPHDL